MKEERKKMQFIGNKGMNQKEDQKKNSADGFLDSPVVKNPPCNARDTGLILDPGRSHMPQSNLNDYLQLTM